MDEDGSHLWLSEEIARQERRCEAQKCRRGQECIQMSAHDAALSRYAHAMGEDITL